MAMSENFLRLLARYSEGLRLAAEHGPASSVVYEYVYRNRPQGSGPFGRWLDRAFLHLRTWDNVRQRTRSTRAWLGELLAQRRAAGQTTMVLDVAAGTARYLRELAHEQAGPDLLIACHDRNPRQVMHGRQLAAAENLARFTFSVGDATDEASYLTSRDPDLILAVGLFAHLSSDDAVRTVMRLAFAHLAAGGGLLCTTLERASGWLTHWEAGLFAGRPFVRPATTVAAWMRVAGFTDISERPSQPGGVALLGWKPHDPRGAD